ADRSPRRRQPSAGVTVEARDTHQAVSLRGPASGQRSGIRRRWLLSAVTGQGVRPRRSIWSARVRLMPAPIPTSGATLGSLPTGDKYRRIRGRIGWRNSGNFSEPRLCPPVAFVMMLVVDKYDRSVRLVIGLI